MDPVPDPLPLRNLVWPGIEPGTSGSVARNSDHQTTEAAYSTMALGSTQLLTEMGARNLPEGKGRPVRKADNLTESGRRLSRKRGSLDGLSQR
jgi:hypothetical protein